MPPPADENTSTNLLPDSPTILLKVDARESPVECDEEDDDLAGVLNISEISFVETSHDSAAAIIQSCWRKFRLARKSELLFPISYSPSLVFDASDANTQTTQTDLSFSDTSESPADLSPARWTECNDQFRILLIFANPTNTHPLRLQAEEKAIRESLQRGECRHNIHVDVLLACTVDDLARQLMSNSYELIHFSGHADRSASLFRHTMKKIHSSYDVDLASLKSPEIVKKVEEAVEEMVQRFESQLLSSSAHVPMVLPSAMSNSMHISSHCLRYAPVHQGRQHIDNQPSKRNRGSSSNMQSDDNPGQVRNSNNFTVTSIHHRNRIEKVIHHTNNNNNRTTIGDAHVDKSLSFDKEKQILTPASVASHLLIREIDVTRISDDNQCGYTREPLVPFGSMNIQHPSDLQPCALKENSDYSDKDRLEHELHIPSLRVKSRSRPTDTIEIKYKKKYSYQDLMDIGLGSLAFEAETHDTSSGINFVSPPSLASLIAQYCGETLQCVLLNVCGGHIQGDVLSSIVPFIVCFTGKVADKESLAFSRGFYDSISMGQSVLHAFRAGSGRMDLHKLSPGVPDRLSSLPPLLTLLKNQKLFNMTLRFSVMRQQQQFISSAQGKIVDNTSSSLVCELQTKNQKLARENEELRSLITFGMDLMNSKEEEIKSMRKAIELLAHAKGFQGTNKKIGGGNSRSDNTSTIYSTQDVDDEKVKTNASSLPRKKYLHVKSSGYGRHNTRGKSSSMSEKKPNFIKRNKAVFVRDKNSKKDMIKRKTELNTHDIAFSSTVEKKACKSKEGVLKSSIEKNLISDKNKHDQQPHPQPQKPSHCAGVSSPYYETDGDVLISKAGFSSSGPLAIDLSNIISYDSTASINSTRKNSVKAQSSLLKTSPARIQQSPDAMTNCFPKRKSNDVQKAFSTTIAVAKPNAWAKYYINDPEGKSFDTEGARRHKSAPIEVDFPVPEAEYKKKSDNNQHTKRRSTSSSQGWRKFLEERRADCKPSSAFASSVPRFDSLASHQNGRQQMRQDNECNKFEE